METTINSQADALMRKIVSRCTSRQGFGLMSSSIYDTAWVSMIPSPAHESGWAFPECFEFILATQLSTGAWPSCPSIPDGILNTAASLLSLKRHWNLTPNDDWALRRVNAERELKSMLEAWDVLATNQAGYEPLVFKHICLLRDEGIDLQLSAWDTLSTLYDLNLNQLPIPLSYNEPTTLLHPLEVFIGSIDFDKIRHLREEDGSILGSPASTAVYLICSSVWDCESESYLRTALRGGTGQENGSVPSAWPTTVLETSSVITVLASVGLPVTEFDSGPVTIMLEESLVAQGNVARFPNTSLLDANNTAKAITALAYLGKSVGVDSLLRVYEDQRCFRTCPEEQHSSVSVNCSILICLLAIGNSTNYCAQIAKILLFICSQFIQGAVQKTRHAHRFYCEMLFSQAMALLYIPRHQEVLRGILAGNSELGENMPQVTFHTLLDIVSAQGVDGSWDGICEVTAYCVLTLSFLTKLPWIRSEADIIERIRASMEAGKSYLMTQRARWGVGHHLWIEKVTCASNVLSEAYCIAAAAAALYARQVDAPFSGLRFFSQYPHQRLQVARKLVQATPLFATAGDFILHVAELQGRCLLPSLERRRLDIFPRDDIGKDTYLAFIPLTWTACQAINRGSVDLVVLREMMMLSMLNYQADEFMETFVERRLSDKLDSVEAVIHRLCFYLQAPPETHHQDSSRGAFGPDGDVTDDSDLELVKSVLGGYVTHILKHPAVLNSDDHIKRWLAIELRTFLLAHITQARDNIRMRARKFTQGRESTPITGYDSSGLHRTYYSWVHGTSADHTSCPFSFVFFICLVSNHRARTFAAPKIAYLAEDLCRHLASMCRMYNDYGSIARDSDEANLNSVDFPEFRNLSPKKYPRDELMWIAEYERRGVETALEKLRYELEEAGQKRVADAIDLFYNVTDLYGQIYVQRDLGVRLKEKANAKAAHSQGVADTDMDHIGT
ncbi:hypothetical protein F5Y10DRAFT_191325 [Nemania abortiva]|nr:hypothetical protein F5Y10DRAFT_191325 [Nemania abortiva]